MKAREQSTATSGAASSGRGVGLDFHGGRYLDSSAPFYISTLPALFPLIHLRSERERGKENYFVFIIPSSNFVFGSQPSSCFILLGSIAYL